MNKVEKLLLEQMENEVFQKTIADDFAFADSLIDQRDLDKFNSNKEED